MIALRWYPLIGLCLRLASALVMIAFGVWLMGRGA